MKESKLSFRQELRIAALESASRVFQGANLSVTVLTSYADDLMEWIGWGPEDEGEADDRSNS